jgi:hypothetical protein
MSKAINFYPTLESCDLEKLGFNSKYHFSFVQNGEEKEVGFSEVNRFITLDEKNSNWDPFNFDLKVSVSISIANGSVLYGENGIAPKGATLGICLEWYSQKAKAREVISSKNNILFSEKSQSFEFSTVFKKNTFDGNIEMNILVFLKQSSPIVGNDESFLNNTEGAILGQLDNKTVFMTGTGSLFPIYTKAIPNGKLWDLEINYENPEIDQLSDSVKLIINSAHKDYCLLDVNNKHYCDRLIYEIVCQSIVVLICRLKEDHCLDKIGGNYADGSIMAFVKYYKEMLNLDISDISTIFSSLHNYLDSKE